MSGHPIYRNVFKEMVDRYPMPNKPSPKEQFWVRDLEENQYGRLEGQKDPVRTEFSSPAEASACIEDLAREAGADLVGFTEVKPSFVFEGVDISHRYAVVLGMEMDYEKIKTAPDPPSGVEALHIYWKLGLVVQKVAEFIRHLGYPASGHQVRTFLKDPPTILHSVAGYEAGLGEFGRMGLLITREFGPRIRLGTVTTDLILPQNERADIGVDRFCSDCQICRQACRGGAIPDEKKEERGFMKYTIDPYRCLSQFARYDGCNECVAACPFNKKREELDRFFRPFSHFHPA